MNVELFPAAIAGAEITLVVEQHVAWEAASKSQHEFPEFDIILQGDLDPDYLGRKRPSVVVTSLFGIAHDAAEIGQKLSDIGFRGRFRATSLALPNPSLIKQEFDSMFPDLDFDILIMKASHS